MIQAKIMQNTIMLLWFWTEFSKNEWTNPVSTLFAKFTFFSVGIANADKPHLTASLWLYCGAHGMRVWLPVFPREVKKMLNLKLYELNNCNWFIISARPWAHFYVKTNHVAFSTGKILSISHIIRRCHHFGCWKWHHPF